MKFEKVEDAHRWAVLQKKADDYWRDCIQPFATEPVPFERMEEWQRLVDCADASLVA